MPDDINLHTTCPRQVTCISNLFIDSYMADADGEYVKIYLYLVRALSAGMPFSLVRMADDLGHTERDIRKALAYWEEKGILRLEYDGKGDPVGICVLDPETIQKETGAPVDGTQKIQPVPETIQPVPETVQPVPETVQPVPETVQHVPEKKSFSREERAVFSKDGDTRELLGVTEQFIGKPLNQSDTDTVLYWHWTLGLSVDLIEYLVEQCASAGHTSIHYMNAVALNWKQKGITTEEEARAEDGLHSRAYHAVARSFGISGRSLTPVEQEYLKRWTSEYGFDYDVLREACERTVRNTGKVSFPYADHILRSWHQAGVHDPAGIRALDEKHEHGKVQAIRPASPARSGSRSFGAFPERKTSKQEIDALEQKLLKIQQG